jgi:glucose-6-phosphate 1-dehydrogenase
MDQNSSTTIVIFGATGDLFRRKLAPALLNLFVSGILPKFFRIVAFGRRPWGDREFREFLSETLQKEISAVSGEILGQFLGNVLYIEGDFNSLSSYKKVAELLSEIDGEARICTNKLLYLATPPVFYELILKNICASGLAIPCAPVGDVIESGLFR